MLFLLVGCVGLTTVPTKDAGTDGGSSTVGALEINASALEFGDVELDTTVSRELTLSNTGGSPIGVELDVQGDGFSVSAESVSVGTESILTVDFTPRTEGPYDGTLDVLLDAGDTLALPLSGNGVTEGGDTDTDTDTDEPSGPGPNITVSPSRYSFGRVDLETPTTTTFTVTNNGDEDLLVSDVVTSAGVWTTGGTLRPPQVISPGSNKLLEVSFTPTAATTYTGSVSIVSDDPDQPTLAVSVDGEGVDLCDICSPLIDVDTGADPYAITDFFYTSFTGADTRTVTIRNLGDEDLVVSNVSVNNDFLASSGTFTIGSWTGAVTLPPYGSDSFTISFRATGACVEVGQASIDMNVVHILSNDPSAGDWVIELSGLAL